MNYESLRAELSAFYQCGNDVARSRAFAERCFAEMDARAVEGMSIPAQKMLQYDVITAEINDYLKNKGGCPVILSGLGPM